MLCLNFVPHPYCCWTTSSTRWYGKCPMIYSPLAFSIGKQIGILFLNFLQVGRDFGIQALKWLKMEVISLKSGNGVLKTLSPHKKHVTLKEDPDCWMASSRDTLLGTITWHPHTSHHKLESMIFPTSCEWWDLFSNRSLEGTNFNLKKSNGWKLEAFQHMQRKRCKHRLKLSFMDKKNQWWKLPKLEEILGKKRVILQPRGWILWRVVTLFRVFTFGIS